MPAVFDIPPRAPFFILRNDVSAGLIGAISDSDTSVNVDIPIEALGWDLMNGDMRAFATLREGGNAEVVIITSASVLMAGVSTTLSITRGADGTMARGFTSAARLSLNANAGLLGQFAGLPMAAIIGGNDNNRYGVYGNAITEAVIANASGLAYIHLPIASPEWRRATIVMRNQTAGFPYISWVSDFGVSWAGGIAPAFGSAVNCILAEIYNFHMKEVLLGRWWGFHV